MPRLSEDDVVDFCLLEAMVAKGSQEQAKAAKEKERETWRGKDARKKWAQENGLG